MGKKMETVTAFIFSGSKITVDGDCSHEVKRRLLRERKAMTNLRQHIKKQRHYFANKGPSVKAMVFPVSCVYVRVGLLRRLSGE